jgi:hypothetical protein
MPTESLDVTNDLVEQRPDLRWLAAKVILERVQAARASGSDSRNRARTWGTAIVRRP